MASARILLVCSLAAALAACRAEAPRQSLKDYAAPAPAPASVAAPPPAPAPAPVPPPARTAAEVESDRSKDQHASCWDRYRDHLAGEKPSSYEEKLSADAHCRLIVCPNCPAEVRE